jgi:hypothetical protein
MKAKLTKWYSTVDTTLLNNTPHTLSYDEHYQSLDTTHDIFLVPDLELPKATNDRASHLNKYYHYYTSVNFNKPNWNLLKSISDDYIKLRESTIANGTLDSVDLSNLISDKERLKKLHKYMTTSLAMPECEIETGIDDIEISFTMPRYWQDDFIDELEDCEHLKVKEHKPKGNYKIYYGNAKRIVFKTGGNFVVHYKTKGGSTHGKCIISFRLAQTPVKNIKLFFACLQEALGQNYAEFTEHAIVMRLDPFFLIKGIPPCILLVEEKDLSIEKLTYPTKYFGLLETLYSGNLKKSCVFAIYDMLVKYEDIKKKIPKSTRSKGSKRLFKKLFKKEMNKISISKIERRLFTHRNGSTHNKIKNMHILKGNAYERLKFYSPQLFNDLPDSIIKKILVHGIATVRAKLTDKQLTTLEKALANPLHHLYFDHEALVSVISNQLKQLEQVILNPAADNI